MCLHVLASISCLFVSVCLSLSAPLSFCLSWSSCLSSFFVSLSPPPPLSLAVAQKHIMNLYNGNFHLVLLKLTESPYKEVQYNCAGIIGHLAVNGEGQVTTASVSTCSCSCVSWLVDEYHSQLLEGEPSAMTFLFRFMQHSDISFVHLALWIMAQFSNGCEPLPSFNYTHSSLMHFLCVAILLPCDITHFEIDLSSLPFPQLKRQRSC